MREEAAKSCDTITSVFGIAWLLVNLVLVFSTGSWILIPSGLLGGGL